jgi:hypothetical protein
MNGLNSLGFCDTMNQKQNKQSEGVKPGMNFKFLIA